MPQEVWRVAVPAGRKRAVERFVRARDREEAAQAWGVEPKAVSGPLSREERQQIGGKPSRQQQ